MSTISLDSKPKTLDFVRNPICFKVTAANMYEVEGVKAVANLVKGGAATVDGDTIDFSFLDYEFTFTFKTTPDDSGFQLTAGSTVNDTYDELLLNYQLTKYYEITLHTSTIRFTAREVGSDFTPTIDASGCSAYVEGTGTSGADPVLMPFFKVFLQVTVADHNATTFREFATTFLDADVDQKVEFYPSDILKDAFDPISPPTFNSNTVTAWGNSVIDLVVNYAEYYGHEPIVRKLQDHKAISLINGKLHNDKWPSHDFINDLADSKMFLTNKALVQDTWKEAHEYLFFMNYVESTYDLTICFDITYTDGTTTQKAKTLTYTDSEHEKIYCIPVGVNQNSLAGIAPSKTISFYKVYIEHEGTLISQARIFYVMPTPDNSLQLLFQNNYGCLDSLLCYNAKLHYKHDSVFIEKVLLDDYLFSEGNDISSVKEQSLEFSTYTGYLTNAEIYQLTELFENNMAFLVADSKYIKIELISNSFTLIDRKSYLQNFEFKFRLSTPGTTSFSEIL